MYKDILVLCCGNILFGDDGFGPYVADYLQNHYQIPENASVINAGTSVRKILFDIILSEKKPKKIVIVDAVDIGESSGRVFEIKPSQIPLKKIDDFSFHQLPSSNLLRELEEFSSVEIKIISVQVENIPETVRPGISNTLLFSVSEVCKKVLDEIKNA